MKYFTLITGASSGIGKELAKAFAERNENVLLVARRGNLLKEICEELSQKTPAEIKYFVCDVTNSSELDNLYEYISTDRITISTLINNAGIGDFSLFQNSVAEKNSQIVDLNINSVLNLSRYFIPQMIKNGGGRILNIASIAAFMPSPFNAVYGAAKSFVLNYSLALASELEEHNIQVSVLCPSEIKTEFQKNANLEKFEVNSKISLQELAEFTCKQFIDKKETLIIHEDTQKHIDMMSKSGNPFLISRNLFKMRKFLMKKLGV